MIITHVYSKRTFIAIKHNSGVKQILDSHIFWKCRCCTASSFLQKSWSVSHLSRRFFSASLGLYQTTTIQGNIYAGRYDKIVLYCTQKLCWTLVTQYQIYGSCSFAFFKYGTSNCGTLVSYPWWQRYQAATEVECPFSNSNELSGMKFCSRQTYTSMSTFWIHNSLLD